MKNQSQGSNLQVQLGRLYARAGKWEHAERVFQRAAAQSTSAESHYFLGNAQFQLGKFPEALASTEHAVSLNPSVPAWLLRLGALNERNGQPMRALHVYEAALELAPTNGEFKKRISKLRKRLGSVAHSSSASRAMPPASTNPYDGFSPAAQRILSSGSLVARLEFFAHSTEANRQGSSWLFHHGVTLLQNGMPSEAVAKFAASLAMSPHDVAIAHYLTLANHLAGNHEAVRAVVGEMTDRADRNEDDFGAATYFADLGQWDNAAALFNEFALVSPALARLRFMQGIANTRINNWAMAQEAFGASLRLDPSSAGQFYHLGLSLERQKDFKGASDAYDAANRLSTTANPQWIYRQAYALHMLGNSPGAITVFLKARPEIFGELETVGDAATPPGVGGIAADILQDNLSILLERHDPEELFEAGVRLLAVGLTGSAIAALSAATRQDSIQNPQWYFHLALAYLSCGDNALAIEAFLSTEVQRSAYDQGAHSYFGQKLQQESMEYVHYSESLALDDVVLFESYHGSKIDCNPAAIYRSVRSDPRYGHLRFAWVVTGKTRVPEDVMQDRNVSLVTRGSRLYRRYLASAKYLVSNVSFPNYFVRRDGQDYLNTWHGTPLKALGKDIVAGFMEHGNVSRNLLQSTHLLAPNQHTQDSLIIRYEAEGLFTGKAARLGTPRIDRMMNQSAPDRAAILNRLGLSDDGKKIVFYAPTWRGTTGNRSFDASRLVDDLRELSRHDYHIVFRAHHLAEAALKNVQLTATMVPADIDTYDVLALTDVLITDYSSIFFDFLPMRRPIVFYAYDLAEYTAQRGLYFDMAHMPGEIAKTTGELVSAIERGIKAGIQDKFKHEQAIEEFAPAEDGTAASKAVDFFFGQNDEHVVGSPVDDRDVILIRHDFDPGPISDRLCTLIDTVDEASYRIAVTFDRAALINNPARRAVLESLPAHVQRVMRAGAHVVSLEERWLLDQYGSQKTLATAEQQDIVEAAFVRESRRVLGNAHIAFALSVSQDPTSSALVSSGLPTTTQRFVLFTGPTEGNEGTRHQRNDFTTATPGQKGVTTITRLEDFPGFHQN